METRGGFSVDLGVDTSVALVIRNPSQSVDTQEITITLEHKSGQKARLRIKAPESVRIVRPAVKNR